MEGKVEQAEEMGYRTTHSTQAYEKHCCSGIAADYDDDPYLPVISVAH